MARFMLYAVALAALLSGCKSGGGKTESSSTSAETQIGNQIWMTENLKVSTFRNGDPIMEVKTLEAWNQAVKEEKPAFCYLNFDQKTEKNMGKLYNYYAVVDPRGLAPDGWHIPSVYEWDDMEKVLLPEYQEEPKLTPLKSKSVWQEYDELAGSNNSGFNAYPNWSIEEKGFSSTLYPVYVGCSWWSGDGKWTANINRGAEYLIIGEGYISNGHAVRCVKD